jgi:RNA-binding protein 8A
MAEEIDFEEEMVDHSAEKADVVESSRSIATKGRGHNRRDEDNDRYNGGGGVFERLEQSAGPGPLQSIEGWIVIVTGVHPEASEDDILDKFSEFGDVKNIHVNLDRRTGFVKGYALVEFDNYEDARSAIRTMNGKTILDQIVHVDWAFVKK